MNANDLLSAVMQLDLEPIKAKLTHAASGEGWSRVRANAVEREYRRFLCLMKLYPDDQLAPTVDVDTFWHYHILDTMKYAVDCSAAFGYFLHHDPSVGIDGAAGEQARCEGGARMRTLYESVFAERYPGAAAQGDIKVNVRHTRKRGSHTGRRAAGSATAYCAGPHIQAGARQPVARSNGARPHGNTTAYCAGPHDALRTRVPVQTGRHA